MAAAVALTACNYTPVETSVAVFVDRTEIEERGRQLLTDPEEVKRIIALVTDREDPQGRLDGGDVTFYAVDDHRLLGRGRTVTLETASWVDNEHIRQADIDSFADAIHDTYAALFLTAQAQGQPEAQTYTQTFLVDPVCQYLRQLGEEGPSARRRVVLFYSDLLEHSSVFSFYTVPPSVITQHRDEAVQRFLDVCHDVDLTVPVSFALVQQPLDIGDSDQKHFEARRIWQLFLNELGLVEMRGGTEQVGGERAAD